MRYTKWLIFLSICTRIFWNSWVTSRRKFYWDNQDHSIYKIITETAGITFQDAGWNANYDLQFHLGIQKCMDNIYEWTYTVLSKFITGEKKTSINIEDQVQKTRWKDM